MKDNLSCRGFYWAWKQLNERTAEDIVNQRGEIKEARIIELLPKKETAKDV